MAETKLQSVMRDFNAWAVEVMHGVAKALGPRHPAAAAPIPRMTDDELKPAA